MEKLKLIKCWKTLLLLISMSLFTGTMYAQDITLRGHVTDQKGEALIGATVRVAGTTNGGTTTDISGNFTLRTGANTTALNVSYVGYITLNVPVRPGATNLGNIVLASDANNLNEVVVVGYGVQNKRDITGATVSVDAKQLAEQPATNVTSQLTGKVAGLDVISGGGGLGAAPVLKLRGNRTIGKNPNDAADQPLIIVDGIPYVGSINDINPSDIKGIEVLKDASSTAIYGSRGANGVLLISTNRGRVGRPITTLNSYYGISTLWGQLDVLDGPQYAKLKADIITVQGLQGGGYNSTYPLVPKELAGVAAGTNTDWQKLLIQPGYVADNTLGVSGGSETTQFNVGAGYRVETDLQPNIRRERYNLQIQLDHQISKVLRFGVNSTNSLTYNNNAGSSFGDAQRTSPLVAPFNPDGSLDTQPWFGTTDATNLSPLYRKYNGAAFYNNTRTFHNFTNMYLEWTIIKGLKYRVTGSYDFNQSLNGSYNGINGGNITTNALTNASQSNSFSYKYVLDNLLTYDRTFDKHHITFTGLFSTEKNHYEQLQANVQGIPFEDVRSHNLALGTFQSFPRDNDNQNTWRESGLISQMARLNYSYDGRYALTATIRNDANSQLAAGKQYLAYPAFGFAWNVTNEKFMQKYTWLDNLKFRAGYGITSNGPNGGNAYQTLGDLTANRYQYGGAATGNVNGLLVQNLINPNLTWQKTAEVNLGIDFGILKNRLTGSIDVYSQRTTGIIMNNILPASTGASSQQTNLGKSGSKGLEIALSSINIQQGGFSWSTDANIAFSRERIIELPNGALENIGNGTFVGWPLTAIYDLKYAGIWQLSDSPGINTGVSQAAGPVYLPVTEQTSPQQFPGQIKVVDRDGNKTINSNDNMIIGTYQPQYTAGLTNRFTYKGFDLSVVMSARMGMTVAAPYLSSGGSAGGWAFLGTGRQNQPDVDYWTPTNQGARWPGPNSTVQTLRYGSTLQYFDGSWIKVRSINLGYTLPAKFLTRVGISSLRVYANVTNPFVIYAPIQKYLAGMDPEGQPNFNPNVVVGTSANGYNGRASGIDVQQYRRQVIFGINLRF